MPGDAMLVAEGLGKHFGGVSVIEDVSFCVARGARTALIGPNGAGKTTLFNLMSGIYPLDRGTISLDGRRIDRIPAKRRIQAGLSRSFQNIRLMPHLSVVENVMLGQHSQVNGLHEMLAPIGWMRGGAARRLAEERLRAAGVDVDPDARVSGLPYGTRKRIEVVRALMSRPRLLMLDEPAAGLNPRETAELSAFLKSATSGELTLLVVEHDMAFVHDLCEHTVVLNFGRLIYDGPTQGVRSDSAVREAYLGTRGAPVEGAGCAA
jgi:branched-chain amino acid transport system ATP-binding protein